MAAQRDAPAITKHILKLARQIDAARAPEYVLVEPRADCRATCCFANVTEVVKMHGGSVQHGWSMRQQAYFAEGTFHAVWRSPDGRLIDVTPRVAGQTQILFMPDSKRVWEGEAVEPLRVQLHETPCYCGSAMPFRICHGLSDD